MIYANAVSAAAGPIELNLDFGYQPPVGEPTWAIRIATTWEHAKLLHDLLGDMLGRYSKDVGEIRDVKPTGELKPLELSTGKDDEGQK